MGQGVWSFFIAFNFGERIGGLVSLRVATKESYERAIPVFRLIFLGSIHGAFMILWLFSLLRHGV